MAEDRVQIIIEAVDKVSETLKRIEGKVDKTGKSFEKTGESITKTTDTLIAVGNAANIVDNIFSSLTNLSLRLENAQERLANANDRLEDSTLEVYRAQRSLGEVMQDTGKRSEFLQEKVERLTRLVKNETLETHIRIDAENQLSEASEELTQIKRQQRAAAEKLEDAKRMEERATRGLIIAENNLARAQNQVIGTYINVGLQTLSLIRTLPQLITSVRTMTVAMGGLNASLGAVGIGLALIGTILGINLLKSNEDASVSTEGLSMKMFGLGDVIDRASNKTSEFIGLEQEIVDSTTISTQAIVDRKFEFDEYNKTLTVTVTTLQDILDKESKLGGRARGQGPIGTRFGTDPNFGNSSITIINRGLNKNLNTKTKS